MLIQDRSVPVAINPVKIPTIVLINRTTLQKKAAISPASRVATIASRGRTAITGRVATGARTQAIMIISSVPAATDASNPRTLTVDRTTRAATTARTRAASRSVRDFRRTRSPE